MQSTAATGGKYGDQNARPMPTKSAKGAILEAQVNAALSGHDIGPFEPVDTRIGGWQAEGRRCHQTVWVGDSGVMYSIRPYVIGALVTDVI